MTVFFLNIFDKHIKICLYKDVILSYGLKSTDSIYHDDELIGYKELVLPQNGNFTLDNINDVKVGVK